MADLESGATDTTKIEYKPTVDIEWPSKIPDQVVFARQVFGVLATQMLIVFGFAIGGAHYKDVKLLEKNSQVMFFSAITAIACLASLILMKPLRKEHPNNYLVLFTATVAGGVLLAGGVAHIDLDV